MGKPNKCTMYRNVDVNENVTVSGSSLGGTAGWESTKIIGLTEVCPNRGNGCTKYNCQ